MRWNHRDFRQAALMTFGLWLLIFLTYCAGELIAGRSEFLGVFPVDFIFVTMSAALVLTAYPVVLTLNDRSAVVRWTVLAVAVLLISTAQGIVNLFENRLLGMIPDFSEANPALIQERFSRSFQRHIYVTFANVVLIAFIVQVRRSADGQVALAEARAATDRERLTALRLQLNPHFLFNALNSVSSLITVGRTREADQMIDSLCDFLRGSLERSADGLVPLSDELAVVENYLDMQMIRFGERLDTAFDIDPELAGRLRLPSFLLQPLVENAIKYAVAPLNRPVTVTIVARIEGAEAVVEVADDGPGAASPAADHADGFGIGLTNTRERLAMQYGTSGGLETGARPGGGWVSRIVVPAPDQEG